MSHAIQLLDLSLTTWHITWGTYATRLHGGPRPTVDKQHNERGAKFISRNTVREAIAESTLSFSPVILSRDQRRLVESELPAICERGGWTYRIGAAGSDHVHLLCDVIPAVHGEKVRRLVKRWLGEELSVCWRLPEGATWWAEEGSNKVVHDESYLNNAYQYILRQRVTPR